MRHEDWVLFQKQEEIVRHERFGNIPLAKLDKAEELRAEVQELAGRIKAELLAELRIEVERLIATETKNGNGYDHISQKRVTVKNTGSE